MKNLLKETIDFLRVNSIEECSKKISWAKVQYISSSYQCNLDGDEDENVVFKLHPTHTDKEALLFLESLDFNYNKGCDIQEVFGVIMLKNNTWLTRCSEGWILNTVPSWDYKYEDMDYDCFINELPF